MYDNSGNYGQCGASLDEWSNARVPKTVNLHCLVLVVQHLHATYSVYVQSLHLHKVFKAQKVRCFSRARRDYELFLRNRTTGARGVH